MFKKFIAILAVFSLVSVSASVPKNDIRQAINKFNFAVTFDWDQQDQEFYNKALKEFKESLSDLSKNGMTNQEIMLGVLASIKNKKQAAELKSLISVIRTEEMSREEAVEFISKNAYRTQDTGARFQGRTNGTVGILIIGLLLATAIYFIHRDNDDDDDTVDRHDHGDCDGHHGGMNDYPKSWGGCEYDGHSTI